MNHFDDITQICPVKNERRRKRRTENEASVQHHILSNAIC